MDVIELYHICSNQNCCQVKLKKHYKPCISDHLCSMHVVPVLLQQRENGLIIFEKKIPRKMYGPVYNCNTKRGKESQMKEIPWKYANLTS